MRYHGNYCGPNWSAGKYQSSVVSDVPAIDEFDETCKQHDAGYAIGGDLYDLDEQFYQQNIGQGVKRTLAAVLVKGQQLYYGHSRNKNNSSIMSKPNLRGAQRQSNKKQTLKASTQPNQVSRINIPSASGYQLGQFKPVSRRVGNTVVVTGREYGTTVNVVNTPTFGAAGGVPLTPALSQSAMLGAHAKCNEKYRFKSLTVHYIPAVPTSSQGQIMLLSSKNINMPFINSASSSFLARGLTQSNAILTPIWQSATTYVDCDTEWRNVDFTVENDIEDNILEEIQVYGWSDATLIAGSVLIDYEIEFKDPVYQPHSTTIPDALGPCTFAACADDSGVNAANDVVILTNSSLTSYPDGTIFRMIFRQSASTLPTGMSSWALRSTTSTAVTSSSSLTSTTNITLNEGSTVYGVMRSGQVYLYVSCIAARSSFGGSVCYASSTTVAGVWQFMVHLVCPGNSLIFTTQ